jgi:hypothetical protein
MRLFIMGGGFTDAGGWWIGPDGKIHKVPGWNPEAVREVSHMVNILREAAQLKTPGLAEAVSRVVIDHVQKELGANLREGDLAVAGMAG